MFHYIGSRCQSCQHLSLQNSYTFKNINKQFFLKGRMSYDSRKTPTDLRYKQFHNISVLTAKNHCGWSPTRISLFRKEFQNKAIHIHIKLYIYKLYIYIYIYIYIFFFSIIFQFIRERSHKISVGLDFTLVNMKTSIFNQLQSSMFPQNWI